MSDLDTIKQLRKSRNLWLLVAVVAASGAAMRWFGVYGPGPGTIDWITITMYVAAILVVVRKHIQLSNPIQ